MVSSSFLQLPAIIALGITIALTPCAHPQQAGTQTPARFEVASIRRNITGSQNTHIDINKGRLVITNASLKTLIRNAYNVQSFQFAGGPRWLDSTMYDIEATTGTGQGDTDDEFRTLLKGLLAERFGLKVHWETRQGPVYALVVAKGGPKIKQSNSGSGINTSKHEHEGHMKGTSEPMSILAANLSNQLRQMVLDKTGLTGNYDWLLVWDPDPTEDSTNPSIFTALQEQLGLKLESQKGPVETLVIDDAQEPSEN